MKHTLVSMPDPEPHPHWFPLLSVAYPTTSATMCTISIGALPRAPISTSTASTLFTWAGPAVGAR